MCGLGHFSWRIYSRLSLSRRPRDSLKYFEISVPRPIRFAKSRKKIWTNTFYKWTCTLTSEVRHTLKILRKRGEIAELLDFYIKPRTSFSLPDKRLFEKSDVEIVRVDCIRIYRNSFFPLVFFLLAMEILFITDSEIWTAPMNLLISLQGAFFSPFFLTRPVFTKRHIILLVVLEQKSKLVNLFITFFLSCLTSVWSLTIVYYFIHDSIMIHLLQNADLAKISYASAQEKVT